MISRKVSHAKGVVHNYYNNDVVNRQQKQTEWPYFLIYLGFESKFIAKQLKYSVNKSINQSINRFVLLSA